jgi:hypothetical protein
MSKLLLNLLVQISKALVYSKIQFLFEKKFSSDFGPSGPAPPTPARYAPQAADSPLGPLGPSRVGIFAERRILFDFAHSGRDAFSLARHCHVGPACQLHPLPHAGRPLPLLRAAQLHPRMLPESLLAPPSSPTPLNPPLNLAPVFNGVKAINAVVAPPWPPLPDAPSVPIKG